MPFRSLFPSGNNEASSSRKRSFAEITGSNSRSQSPQHSSSKRRRIRPAASPSSNRNRSSTPYSFTIPESFERASRDYQPTSEQHPSWPDLGRFEPVSERYEGDGLDFRRPVMSTSTGTEAQDSTVIDLTADDSSPQPETSEGILRIRNRRRTGQERWNEAAEVSSVPQQGEEVTRLRNADRARTLARIQYARDHGPRFGRDIIGDDTDELELINLVDSDDMEDTEADHDLGFEEDLFENHIDLTSPDITFLGERRAPAENRNNYIRLPTPLPTPLPTQSATRRLTPQMIQYAARRGPPDTLTNLRELVRQGTFGRGLSENEFDDAREAIDRETLDRIDGVRDVRPNFRNTERTPSRLGDTGFRELPFGFPMALPPRPNSTGIPDFIDVDELEMDMNLDYEATAFPVGDADGLEIVEPPVWQAMNAGRGDTPIELVKEPYIRPKPLVTGFTMNFKEDESLYCPNCHDELSVGSEGSAKEQVWMIKNCGHVYCGECAINRAASKQKEKARMVQMNVTPFKACLVKDCGKSVISKTAMFQVYL